MRLILLLTIVTLTTACTPSPLDKAKQAQVCENNGGVYKYTTWGFKVTCRDGSLHDWVNTTLKPEYYPEGKS